MEAFIWERAKGTWNCLVAFQSHYNLFISLAWSSRILTIFSLNAFNSHWCQSWGSLVSTRCVVERSWGWGHLAASGAMVTTWAGPHTYSHWANIHHQERNWASDLQTYTVFCIYLLPCCSHFISLQETISKALYFKWIMLCKCLRSECWQHCHHSQAVSASAGNGHPGDSSRSDQCHHESSNSTGQYT